MKCFSIMESRHLVTIYLCLSLLLIVIQGHASPKRIAYSQVQDTLPKTGTSKRPKPKGPLRVDYPKDNRSGFAQQYERDFGKYGTSADYKRGAVRPPISAKPTTPPIISPTKSESSPEIKIVPEPVEVQQPIQQPVHSTSSAASTPRSSVAQKKSHKAQKVSEKKATAQAKSNDSQQAIVIRLQHSVDSLKNITDVKGAPTDASAEGKKKAEEAESVASKAEQEKMDFKLNVLVGLLSFISAILLFLVTKVIDFSKTIESISNVANNTSIQIVELKKITDTQNGDAKKILDKLSESLISIDKNLALLNSSFTLHRSETGEIKSDVKVLKDKLK